MREKVGKSRFTVFFQWFGAPEGRKVGSLKRRVRSQLARGEMKNCTPLWREAHFQVKMYKTPGARSTFGSWDVEKVHAVVARSTFRSQNVQNTRGADHFWHLRCRKSARRCGAKHIFKSKCTKHTSSGPLLAVEMSKKCTPLWREAHFEVKMYKTPQCRTTFGSWKTLGVRTTFGSWHVGKVHAVVARSTFWSQNVKNTRGSDHFWRLRRRFASLHYTTLHYTTVTLHYTTHHNTTITTTQLHSTTLSLDSIGLRKVRPEHLAGRQGLPPREESLDATSIFMKKINLIHCETVQDWTNSLEASAAWPFNFRTKTRLMDAESNKDSTLANSLGLLACTPWSHGKFELQVRTRLV